MDEVLKELAVRKRITAIYNKPQDAFDTKEAYDNYLETIEDIIFKLSCDVDVAEVEQQVADYQRQEEATAGAAAAGDAATYVPLGTGTVLQPMPTVQVQLDKQGTLIVSSTGQLSRPKWMAMAQASGWTDAIATRRALQDAFSSIFI